MKVIQKITPCLWFDDQAEEAVEFYTAVFRNSIIVNIARYGKVGYEVHGKPAGTVMTVAFESGWPDVYRTQWRTDIQIQ